jgi:hypothetical protein
MMKPRQVLLLAQVALVPLAGLLLLMAAERRARDNALTAFTSYSSAWEDVWRAPVEHRAVEVLGRLLPIPEADPVLARMALEVMRQSSSWVGMAPVVTTQLRSLLDSRLADPAWQSDRLRPTWELLVQTGADDLDPHRERIIALAGDRAALAAELTQAAAALRAAQGDQEGDAAVARLARAWHDLLAPVGSRPLIWLARTTPLIAEAEAQATGATMAHLRRLLEPYGVRSDGDYGETLPDQAMITWLDQQARTLHQSRPDQRQRLARLHAMLRLHLPDLHYEPVVEVAVRIAVRNHALPFDAILTALLVVLVLGGGLVRAMLRLHRGPMPVDVNAETMENVEPIDLDTDAETRSRSSAGITDVG